MTVNIEDLRTAFTVDRKEWAYGDAGITYGLWDDKEKCGCIMGHYMLACGYKQADIVNQGDPAEVVIASLEDGEDLTIIGDLEEWLLDGEVGASLEGLRELANSAKVRCIININDEEDRDPAEIEATLITRFEEVGVELDFTGEYRAVME